MVKYKIDYKEEELDLILIKEILIRWVAKNRPDIVKKAHNFVKQKNK